MNRLTISLIALACTVGCDRPTPSAEVPPAPTSTPAPSAEAPTDAPAAAKTDDVRGGQLYDRWWALEPYRSSFVPDDRETEAVDGKGGPNGDGTLNDGAGQPMANTGHEYRLKNFYGWDLRGAEGIYGPSYQNKPHVFRENLLAIEGERDALVERLRKGGEGLPAYGDVLSDDDLRNLAAFIVSVRDGALPRPDQIFALDDKAPKGYRLLEGGDAERGKRYFEDTCAGCHGADGQKKLFEGGKHSLGSHARTSAYEDWFKIVSGQPGTAMGRQLPGRHSGSQQAQLILDLFAALCDRSAFPAAHAAEDAPEGDRRCGAYGK